MNKEIKWTVTAVNRNGIVIDREYFCTRKAARIYKSVCKNFDDICGYKRFIDRYLPGSVR